MKTLLERMHLSRFVVADAYVIENAHLTFGDYSTFTFICAELCIDLSDVSIYDFESASDILTSFVRASNDDTGYTISVWFD